MSTDPRRPSGSGTLPIILTVVGLVILVYGSLEVGTWLATGKWVPGHPLKVVTLFIKQDLSVQIHHWVALALILMLLAFPLFFWMRYRSRRAARERTIDRTARYMGSGRSMSYETAQAKATEGRLAAAGIAAGLLIGRSVRTGRDMWAAWREGLVVMMGPGGGKTTSIAIPMICEAPGLVVATSNKRDLADAVVGPRQVKGGVWVFDPQFLAGDGSVHTAPWYWNPLSYVTDEIRASAMAKLFATSTRDQNARTDAYWDGAAQTLIADLLLCAAHHQRRITDVFLWLQDSRDDTPVRLLEKTDYTLPTASLRNTYSLTEKQRNGVFDSAAKTMSFLNNGSMSSWVQTTSVGDHRPQFRHRDFAQSDTDTLLSLSKEGHGTAGPLTAALTVAVTEAIEERASHMPNGRLQTPALLMLDEAANTCRWHELPAQYSHYGSRGMMLVTILQNWAQGERAWRKEGMEQMWSAATVRIVGPGLADTTHLENVSKLAGDRHVTYYSTSNSRSNKSSGTSLHKERVLSVADLAAMPHGRMLVIPNADEPVLAKQIPWWERPTISSDVQRSIKQLEPSA